MTGNPTRTTTTSRTRKTPAGAGPRKRHPGVTPCRAGHKRQAKERNDVPGSFHGRGGQGVVTAAELLAAAAFGEGRYAQAFPSFGSERMGAPVMSFCRIDGGRSASASRSPSRTRSSSRTDVLHQGDLFGGLTSSGYVIINATRGFAQLGLDDLAATTIAVGCSRSQPRAWRWPGGRPLPGAPLLARSPRDRRGQPGRGTRRDHRPVHRPGRRGTRAAAVAAFDYALAERFDYDRAEQRS